MKVQLERQSLVQEYSYERKKKKKSRMPAIFEVSGLIKSPETLHDLLKEILQAKLLPRVIYNTSLISD